MTIPACYSVLASTVTVVRSSNYFVNVMQEAGTRGVTGTRVAVMATATTAAMDRVAMDRATTAAMVAMEVTVATAVTTTDMVKAAGEAMIRDMAMEAMRVSTCNWLFCFVFLHRFHSL